MIWPFSKWRERKAAVRIEDNNAYYRELFGVIESKTGVSVNWRTAQQAITAMACARVIAEGLAQVPCRVFRLQGGKRKIGTDLSLYDLLAVSPNDFQTSYDFFEMLGLHLVFAGGGYSFPNRYRSEIRELLPYEPQYVTVDRDGWDLKYKISVDMGEQGFRTIDLGMNDIWHVRGPSWNGWMGLEGVKLAREAIGLSVATEEHGSRIFRNGAHIGGILQSDQPYPGKDKAKEMREAWDATFAGSSNTGKTAVTWHGLKWVASQMLNDAAQLLETRNFQVEETCRSFRVLPIMVGHMNSKAATFASSEQMFLAHVVHTMGPWYARIERSINKFLLTEKERKAGYYAKFVIAALMRGAAKDRAEYFAKALGSGGAPAWMTQDEVRGLEELDAMGGDAAELPKPTNVGGTPAAKEEGTENA